MARVVVIKGRAGTKCGKPYVSEMAFELILTLSSSILFKGGQYENKLQD